MPFPARVDVWQTDAVAATLRERAGVDPDEPILVTRLAEQLGIRVRVVPHANLSGDARLEPAGDGWRIIVRKGLSRERARFAVAHELAEWALRDEIDERIEDACNVIAAAILAPRRAFLRRSREVGKLAFDELASPFGISQTTAALRSAEVSIFPLAIDCPGALHLRGPDDWVWGTSTQIRGWARGTPRPGLQKVRITDEPRHMALVEEDQRTINYSRVYVTSYASLQTCGAP